MKKLMVITNVIFFLILLSQKNVYPQTYEYTKVETKINLDENSNEVKLINKKTINYYSTKAEKAPVKLNKTEKNTDNLSDFFLQKTSEQIIINNENLNLTKFSIFDIEGRIIDSRGINEKDYIYINLMNLNNGFYFVNFTSVNDNNFIMKIVK